MDKLLFGTGGVPHGSKTPSTLDGIRHIGELGLGCMELEFVQRVNLSEAAARLVHDTAVQAGVTLSAHASYYINFNAREPDKVQASQQRLLQAARIAAIAGAQSVIVHTAFYMSDPPEKTYETVKKNLKEVLDTLKKEENTITIRPEIMGKPTQFGTVDEVMQLCTELEGLAPCLDVAHWHARSGSFNTYPEFAEVLTRIKDKLGRVALDSMHIHFSGINYGARGEKNHLDLEESDFNYKDLIKAFSDFDIKGLVICESPSLEGDAQLLQKTYQNLTKAAKK